MLKRAAIALLFLFLPVAATLVAATVTGDLRANSADTGYSTQIIFWPLTNPAASNTVTYIGKQVTAPAVGGLFSASLAGGDYQVTFPGGNTNTFNITVPGDAGSYNLNALITAGTNTSSGDTAYTKAQSDARFALIGSSGSSATNLVPAGALFTDQGGYGGYNLTVTPGQLYYATATTNTTAYGLFIVDGVNAGVDPQYGPLNGVSAPTPVFFTPASSTIQLVNDTVLTGSAAQIAIYAATNIQYGIFRGDVFADQVIANTVAGGGAGLSNLTHVVASDDAAGSLGLKDSTLTLGFGNGLTAGSSDSLFHVQSLATSPYNSGSGINFDIMGVNPATGRSVFINGISSSIVMTRTNSFQGILPGHLMVVCNQDAGYMRGFSICAPGISGLDDGNSSLFYCNITASGTGAGIPLFVKGVWQPTDTAYAFTVSGVTTPPNVNDIYTNNNQRFTIVRGTSLSGGAGTIFATVGGGGAPTSSGTLKRATGNLAPGDSTINFSAATITGKWVYAFYVNPVNGTVQMCSNLYVTNMVTAALFSGSGASLTSIPESAVTSLTSDLAAKAPIASPTFTGTATAGTFSGSGASLTSIPESAVTSLTSDLAAKAALATAQTFSASNTFTSGIAVTGQLLNTNVTGNYIYGTNGGLVVSNASTSAYISLSNNVVASQHFGGIKVGSGPSVAVNTAGAGTGGTASFSTDDNPNDSAMRIHVVTGSSPAASAIVCTVTFSKAWVTKPKILVKCTTKGVAAGAYNATADATTLTTTSFDLVTSTTVLAAATTYDFDVICMQ